MSIIEKRITIPRADFYKDVKEKHSDEWWRKQREKWQDDRIDTSKRLSDEYSAKKAEEEAKAEEERQRELERQQQLELERQQQLEEERNKKLEEVETQRKAEKNNILVKSLFYKKDKPEYYYIYIANRRPDEIDELISNESLENDIDMVISIINTNTEAQKLAITAYLNESSDEEVKTLIRKYAEPYFKKRGVSHYVNKFIDYFFENSSDKSERNKNISEVIAPEIIEANIINFIQYIDNQIYNGKIAKIEPIQSSQEELVPKPKKKEELKFTTEPGVFTSPDKARDMVADAERRIAERKKGVKEYSEKIKEVEKEKIVSEERRKKEMRMAGNNITQEMWDQMIQQIKQHNTELSQKPIEQLSDSDIDFLIMYKGYMQRDGEIDPITFMDNWKKSLSGNSFYNFNKINDPEWIRYQQELTEKKRQEKFALDWSLLSEKYKQRWLWDNSHPLMRQFLPFSDPYEEDRIAEQQRQQEIQEIQEVEDLMNEARKSRYYNPSHSRSCLDMFSNELRKGGKKCNYKKRKTLKYNVKKNNYKKKRTIRRGL